MFLLKVQKLCYYHSLFIESLSFYVKLISIACKLCEQFPISRFFHLMYYNNSFVCLSIWSDTYNLYKLYPNKNLNFTHPNPHSGKLKKDYSPKLERLWCIRCIYIYYQNLNFLLSPLLNRRDFVKTLLYLTCGNTVNS